MMGNPGFGYPHGGILPTLVDPPADRALAATKPGRPFPTVGLWAASRRPAKKDTLKAHGKVVRLGSAFSTHEAGVEKSNGKLVLSGRGACATTIK